MKLTFTVDTDDNLAHKEADLSFIISTILGSRYGLSRQSGEFNEKELQESAQLAGAAQLPPANALPATATSLPASTAQLPATTGSVELDSTGIPHDPRIHAKPAAGNPPTKNADGKWKKKKGVDDATFAAVSAELLRVVGGGATPATAAQSPALPTIQAENQPPASLPQLPPVSLPNKAVEVVDFPTFAEWVAANHSDKLTALLNQLLTHYGLVDGSGVPSLPLLQHKASVDPSIIKTCHNWLRVQL